MLGALETCSAAMHGLCSTLILVTGIEFVYFEKTKTCSLLSEIAVLPFSLKLATWEVATISTLVNGHF